MSARDFREPGERIMKRALALLTMSISVLACTGAIDGGDRGPSSVDPGAAGTGVVGSGTAGTSVVGSASAGTGVVGSGSAGTGVVGGGTAGTGVVPTGGAGTGVSGAPACGPGAIPADVAAVISSSCIACHGSPPLQGVPSSLATYASLTAKATTDPTKTVAAVALARMQPGAMLPMPPPPLPPATAAQVAAFQSWVSAGTPPVSCPDGGAPVDAGATGGIIDPYSTAVVCTSKTMWTLGDQGNGAMYPGKACVACHAMAPAIDMLPIFTVAGTVYPTAHEPDNCLGGAVATMSKVVIKGADGKTVTLTPDTSGNFAFEGAVAKPYTASVTYMGRVRAMVAPQTSGDCNGCHTQMGAMMAPGRIMLP
jgi:hypothetical protein